MKRSIIVLSSIVLLIAVCLCIFSGCKQEAAKKISPEERLYNWLLDNGELINGTNLVYQDNNFSLHTDHSKKMFVDYTISDYNGYEITIQLPLYSESKKNKVKISVQNTDSSSTLACYHYPETFTLKTPLEYDTLSQYPDYDYINMSEYGTTKSEDGKMVFYVDESKREELEERKQYNAEIDVQRNLREKIAKEISNKSISDILEWLQLEICPEAEMDISDFGYKAYK